ncbi:MAG: hypothetical protein IKL68_00600 [Clostridia bacterium]|nr:hypothetical protein [Clostridia bacterium]
MQKKKGISLIVLVITIIVMIILAAAIIISMSNNGVIYRANNAVNLTNEKQVQDLASLIWAEAYLDEERTDTIENVVKEKLEEQGITDTDWDIQVSDTGIIIKSKEDNSNTLGALITSDNYGDTVDYTVTVDGTTYDEWQIYYHNEDYVYLIAKENVKEDYVLPEDVYVSQLTYEEKELYEKFRVGNWPKYTLVDSLSDVGIRAASYSSMGIAAMIKEYANFANTDKYGTDVVGAIGGVTIELFAAAWNAKNDANQITLSIGDEGYLINNKAFLTLETDGFLLEENNSYSLLSPTYECNCCLIQASNNTIGKDDCDEGFHENIRPAVCLKASIPASVGTKTNFSLEK